MTRYAITPWRTQADLVRVREQLYSLSTAGEDVQRHAINRVMAWKLRGNLPHAVESTALLVDAILHHTTGTNSTFSIRAVYGAAFCRFVTGFCDIGRNKERLLEPSSMLDIAKQIDMPAEFVALRHEATHDELPGIQRLANATQRALEWLWRVYWSRMDGSEGVEASETDVITLRNEVAAVLRAHRRRLRLAVRNKMSSVERRAQARQSCKELSVLCNDERRLRNSLITVLIKDEFMFPSVRGLGTTMQGAYTIWDDLIHEMDWGLDAKFVHELGLALLQSLTTTSSTFQTKGDVVQEALAEWLVHLIGVIETGEGQTDSLLAPEIVKQCCMYPGYWTQKVGLEVFELCANQDNNFEDDWGDLFKASLVPELRSPTLAGTESFASEDDGSVNLPQSYEDLSDSSPDQVGGWTRAILPPSAPIGMVNS